MYNILSHSLQMLAVEQSSCHIQQLYKEMCKKIQTSLSGTFRNIRCTWHALCVSCSDLTTKMKNINNMNVQQQLFPFSNLTSHLITARTAKRSNASHLWPHENSKTIEINKNNGYHWIIYNYCHSIAIMQ